MMPDMLRDSLGLGYLLLRNADTLEDAYRWPRERRIDELRAYRELLGAPSPESAASFAERFSEELQLV